MILALLPALALTSALAAPASAAPAATTAAAADLTLSMSGLRDARGLVLLCLTRRVDHWFECEKDPARVTRSVPAAQAGTVDISGLEPGQYAVLAIHDANRNGRLDTMFGIPREGFGFSRNPAMRMGPPRYADVDVALAAGANHQAIKLRYLF